MMKTRRKAQPYLKFLLYGVAVALINIVGISLFFRVDLSAGNKYSLSAASREVLAKVSQPLTIKIFFTRNLPAPHNITEQYLHDLMAEYAADAGKTFNYQFYNVTPDGGEDGAGVPADQRLAGDYGIYPVQVQNIEADELKVKKAYMGLVIIYGDMVETLSPIRSTDGLEYQITTAVRKLVDKISAFSNLPEKVHLALFLSSSIYPVAPYMGIKELSALPEAVSKVVAGLNERLAGKLNFEAVDPAQAPGRENEIQGLDLIRLQWPDIAQRGGAPIPAGEGVIGLVMRYRDKTVTLPLLNVMDIPFFGTRYSIPDTRDMETLIDESLASLVGINDDIGYLSGHGTPEAAAPNTFGQQPAEEDSIANFRLLTAQNYSLVNINPAADGLNQEAVDCLIIARPTEPFSDFELFQIDQFLMRGKNLAIFLDQFQEVNAGGRQSPYAQPRHVPVNTGLEKLLAHYGVRIKQSTVMDEACFKRPADPRFGEGEQPIYFAPLINNEYINHRPAFMQNIRGLVAMTVSPLELLTDTLEANKITATTLFSSSRRSWEHPGPISFNTLFIQPPGPDVERRSLPLACLLEGEFPSYFAGKPIPVREAAAAEEDGEDLKTGPAEKQEQEVEAVGRVLIKSKPARIFVMGSSQMLYDHMLDTDGRFPNSVFVMNLLDTLNNRDNVALLRSKQQVYNPVREVPAFTRSLIKWGNVAGLPVLVIVSGCLIWLRRLSRKRHIRMMFSR